MEESYRHCRADSLPYFLLAIGFAGEARQEAAEPGVGDRIRQALILRIAELPRAEDFLVGLEGDRLLVVIPDMPVEAAEVISQLLIAGARELLLDGESEPRRISLEVGIAIDQERELYFETLVLVACEGAQVARARGGECAIHSELYGLLQNRIERQAREATGESAALPEADANLPALEPEADAVVAEDAKPLAEPGEQERLAAQLQSLITRDSHRRGKREMEEQLRLTADQYAAEAVARAEAERKRLLEIDPSSVPPLADPAAAVSEAITAPSDRGQVERLERRLHKLVATLEDTERRLAEVSRLKGVEFGIASAYRGVQGLAGGEKDFELKQALMQKLLDSNLELRRQLGGSGSAA